jgi:uncharacterized membrane protein
MTFISRFHPLLVHFPIALVLAAAGAECAVIATTRNAWRTVAVANIRAAAAMAVVTAITGWIFATAPWVDLGPTLEWHRWLGMAGATAAIGAALLSSRLHGASPRSAFAYRFMLFVTALLVTVTAHSGGSLVWGAGFFRP